MITVIVFIIVFCLMGLGGYLIWAMQNRIEVLSGLFADLKTQLDEGETAIVENFKVINKGLKRLENEIKSLQRSEPKAKEAIRAARIARRQESE